jgi:hypothetical protein
LDDLRRHPVTEERTMPLPKLDDSQIVGITREVARYIESQRQIYRPEAVPLDQNGRAAMQAFFPPACLEATRLALLSDHRVTNPPFYGQLIKMGFDAITLPDFRRMTAITFVDTVVSHALFTYRLLFHELVHVVQYEKLGWAEFAAKYVRGFLSGGSYEAIPLERNAYELDARFAAAPSKHFSVEAEVEAWIREGRF